MWLINCDLYKLEYFVTEDSAPEYTILSHTWGDDEITFDDRANVDVQERAGFTKIRFCCKQAKRDHLTHAWVDT
jgi:hypothetical protein